MAPSRSSVVATRRGRRRDHILTPIAAPRRTAARPARHRRAARRVRRGAARRGRQQRDGGAARRGRRARARSRGPSPTDFREALAATLAKSQEDRRIFELVFERFFFRAAEAAAIVEGVREGGAGGGDGDGGEGGEVDLEDAAPPDRRGPARRLGERACATSRGWRSPRSGARATGSGVIGVDVQRIRRALGLRAEPQPELPARRPAPRRRAARGAAPLRGAAAPRARARPDRAHRDAAAVAAAATSSTARCRRARCRTSRPCTASSRSSSAG